MALKTNSKIKFDNGNSTKKKESIVPEEVPKKSKHIKFGNDDDDEDVVEESNNVDNTNGGGGGGKSKKQTEKKLQSKKSEKSRKNAMDIGTHWYQEVSFICADARETAHATNAVFIFSLLSTIATVN